MGAGKRVRVTYPSDLQLFNVAAPGADKDFLPNDFVGKNGVLRGEVTLDGSAAVNLIVWEDGTPGTTVSVELANVSGSDGRDRFAAEIRSGEKYQMQLDTGNVKVLRMNAAVVQEGVL